MNNETHQVYALPAGEYFIGDVALTMSNDEFERVCTKFEEVNWQIKYQCIEGKHVCMSDTVQDYVVFKDQNNCPYKNENVFSFGCVSLNDVNPKLNDVGRIVTAKKHLIVVVSKDGMFKFRIDDEFEIIINTEI
jgi:hypothetical protein